MKINTITLDDSMSLKEDKDTNSSNSEINNDSENGISSVDLQTHINGILNHTVGAEMYVPDTFPSEVFPLLLQQIIKETNESLNYPIDFIAASMLYAVSVAVGNTYRIEVKKGWTESVILYLAIVARAGTNKSAPLSFAIAPLVKHDQNAYNQYKKLALDYENVSKLTQKQREEQGIDEPTKPIWQKFLLSDFTPEALAQVHKFNHRGIGVYADELAGWFKNFNRYNKGSDSEFWLSAWSSKPINIDRKNSEPIFIPLPCIPVAGTIQTGILQELAKQNRTQNGFIDRILFVIPGNLQSQYWSETEIDPEIIRKWDNVISNLLNSPIQLDPEANPIPQIIQYEPEAKRLLIDWQRKNTDQSNSADSDALAGIYSKMELYAIRFSLILEMISFACNESDKQAISIEAVKGAIKLVEYFKISAIKVNTIISNNSPLNVLPEVKKNLYNLLPEKFTRDEGLAMSLKLDMSRSAFDRFLADNIYFKKLKFGKYEKLL